MTDLTAIKTPFGLLDRETQEALKAHGGPYEFFDGKEWRETKAHWCLDLAYRVKPAPPKPREWWCVMDTARGKNIPYGWSTSRKGAADMLGADSAEIIHVREVLPE